MKYLIVVLSLVFGNQIFSQNAAVEKTLKHEITTDLSAAFMNNYRVDYNRMGKGSGAFVLGLRTRSESVSVTLDTNIMLRLDERILRIPQGSKSLDISVGVKTYLGVWQPQRGLWFQLTVLTSLYQWESQAYRSARTNSFYPDEYRRQLQMFGLEGDIGYRYVFDNGLSLNAFVSWTQLFLRSEFISDRFTQAQRESAGMDGALSGSFLTIGYVW